jgi:hypothetical protein
MRKTHTRIAAGVMAIFAAVLAGFALRPTPQSAVTLAARNPAVEVRTVVIRRTIHVTHHAQKLLGRRTIQPTRGGVAGAAGGHGRYLAATHTGASGAHRTTSGYSASPAAPSTRSSGSHASAAPAGSSSGSSARPVSTRTSGSHASGSSSSGSSSSGAAKPVTTRTSGSHSGASSSGGSGHPVTTRTSGGGGERGDGGGD